MPGDRLDPAECLLDALADGIAAGSFARQSQSCDRWCSAQHAASRYFVNELRSMIFGVIGFVSTKRDRCRPVGAELDHVQRGHPFGMPVSQCQAGVDQQAVAVFHQPMPDEAQLRLVAFAVEPGIRISGRSMGVVRALLAMEVRFGIASAALHQLLARAVLLDALEAQASISVP